MQTVAVILAFLALATAEQGASGASAGRAAGLSAVASSGAKAGATQSRTAAAPWTIDVSGSVFREAWDRNESSEWLSGAMVSVDRPVWRAIAIRAETLLLRVAQRGDDAWLRGVSAGTRIRWTRARIRPVIDVAIGVSDSTARIPPRGTQFNYLAVIGSGIESRVRGMLLTVTGRWLHASNNGREGRGHNPDIQSLGVVVGVALNR